MAPAAPRLLLLLVLLEVRGAAAGCPRCPPRGCAQRPAAADYDQCLYTLQLADGDATKKEAEVEILISELYFSLNCDRGVRLEGVALPRFQVERSVQRAHVLGCAAPAQGYAALLRELGVAPHRALTLAQLPAANLSRAHFARLPPLRALHVRHTRRSGEPRVTADADFLAPLEASLRELTLLGVALPPDVLRALPRGLEELDVADAALQCEDGCAQALRRLPRLRLLRLNDLRLRVAPTLPAAVALRTSYVIAPVAQPLLSGKTTVENATFLYAENVTVEGCGAVRRLMLGNAKVEELPRAWLRECPGLQLVQLSRMGRLRTVAADALSGALALVSFELTGCRELRSLPEQFFAKNVNLSKVNLSNNGLIELPPNLFGDDSSGSKNLHILNLKGNKLKALPGRLLSAVPLLERLDLSHNEFVALSSGVFKDSARLSVLDVSYNKLARREALEALQVLRASLTTLSLANNPLGDLCQHISSGRQTYARSVLDVWGMQRLEILQLSSTRATRLCDDWKSKLPALQGLLLADNNITVLYLSDLNWAQQNLTVDLSGNPIRSIVLRPSEAQILERRPKPPEVEIKVDSELSCDCTMYWFEEARRALRLPVKFRHLRCASPGPTSLNTLQLSDMECGMATNMDCPVACDCRWRPARNATLVRCANAGLSAPPALRSRLLVAEHLFFDLSDNNLTALPAPDTLPAILEEIDLRNNSIRGIGEAEAAAATALVARAGITVRLAGNPLRCACADPLLHLLRAPHIADFESLRCEDGRSPAEALAQCVAQREATQGAGIGRAWLWALGALATVGAVVASAALHSAMRLRLKAFLLARGLCLGWINFDDDDCKYDAFLSYSHLDEAAANELVAELESGPRPLRLCLHHRDWPVGGWIPAQIAESVAASRRTVVLLSDHFMSSGWARTELREAAAHALRRERLAPRLIVVLLNDEPPKDLDPELHRYVHHNTYLKRSDPLFWQKLRLALPPPKGAIGSRRAPRRSRSHLRKKARHAALAIVAPPPLGKGPNKGVAALPPPHAFASPA